MHPQTFCLTQQPTSLTSLVPPSTSSASLSLSRVSLPRSIALALTNLCWLCVCVCVCGGEGELCAISGLNFKRSSNFHTIFRLRSFALSTATLALGLVCTSQQPIPAPVPAPVPLPCSALADSPLLVGTCSVTHSSSSDSSCAFHIFACASCHLCHRNISNTCHSTGVW